MKSNSKVYLIVISVMTCLMLITAFAFAKTWEYGGIEYRLPKPIEEIQIPTGLPEYHVVVPGDCLWAISGHYLNDPFLWPLIWEENLDTISNPHLIFPDQHVKLPGGGEAVNTAEVPVPIVPGEVGQEEEMEAGSEGEGFSGEGEFTSAPKQPEPHSVTSETAVIAAGYISKEKFKAPVIIGANTESFDLATLDVAFLDGGTNADMEPDQDLYIMRRLYKVYHPITGKYMGYMYHIVGEARNICVNEYSTSTIIKKAYQSVWRGDFVVPKKEIPIPYTLGSPVTDPCNPSTKQLPGTIIDAYCGGEELSDAVILGKGQIAYIDLGSHDGVAPGDYFTIFKRNYEDPRLPRYVSGEAMVVKVAEDTSVVVLTQSRTAVFIGDQIEQKQ